MIKKISLILFSISICFSIKLKAQDDDMLKMLEDSIPKKKTKEYVYATFKGKRLINFHTVEMPGPNSLEFRISHHFGDLNSGSYNFWGLDGGASIRLGLEYSKNGRFEVGVGRSSLEKNYDGFLKYKLIKQTIGRQQPFTITLFAGMYYTTLHDPNAESTGIDRYQYQTSRLSYAYQVIIARKFNSRFSLQLSPTMVHYNIVDKLADKNDLFAVALATRVKITKRISLELEYEYRINDYSVVKYYDAVGVGIDIETGGHVFQIFVTNCAGMIEPQVYGHNTSDWQNMELKIGFNISRMFVIGGKKKKK